MLAQRAARPRTRDLRPSNRPATRAILRLAIPNTGFTASAPNTSPRAMGQTLCDTERSTARRQPASTTPATRDAGWLPPPGGINLPEAADLDSMTGQLIDGRYSQHLRGATALRSRGPQQPAQRLARPRDRPREIEELTPPAGAGILRVAPTVHTAADRFRANCRTAPSPHEPCPHACQRSRPAFPKPSPSPPPRRARANGGVRRFPGRR